MSLRLAIPFLGVAVASLGPAIPAIRRDVQTFDLPALQVLVEVTVVGPPVALIGNPVAMLSQPVPLVSDAVPFIGYSVSLISRSVPLVSGAIPLIMCAVPADTVMVQPAGCVVVGHQNLPRAVGSFALASVALRAACRHLSAAVS